MGNKVYAEAPDVLRTGGPMTFHRPTDIYTIRNHEHPSQNIGGEKTKIFTALVSIEKGAAHRTKVRIAQPLESVENTLLGTDQDTGTAFTTRLRS